MKKFILCLPAFLFVINSLFADQFDTSRIAYSNNYNYKNPSFEKRNSLSYFTLDFLTLSYEKWDTLYSKSNIGFRKVLFDSLEQEVLLTNDNFLNTNPSASHTMIVWQSNRNSNLDIFYSLYSGSAWSAPLALQATPNYEMNPAVGEFKSFNMSPAYFIVYQRDGDIYLKTFFEGNFLLDSNLTGTVTEGCTSPIIQIYQNTLVISYLKSVGPVQRLVISRANISSNYTLTGFVTNEIIQAKSVSGINFSNGFASSPFGSGFINYNYDTLGALNSMGQNVDNYTDRNVFTAEYSGRNINSAGSVISIITDNPLSSYYFTVFGWNRKTTDSSMIIAYGHFNFSWFYKTKRFYHGDSSVSTNLDVSNYVPKPGINSYRFRIAWEKKINNRIALYEARFDDHLSNIENENSMSNNFKLEQNYPNPFNPTTVINYELRVTSYVSLKVYDALGNIVETLIDGNQNAGNHTVQWNAENYPSGIYFYKIRGEGFSETKKMILIR